MIDDYALVQYKHKCFGFFLQKLPSSFNEIHSVTCLTKVFPYDFYYMKTIEPGNYQFVRDYSNVNIFDPQTFFTKINGKTVPKDLMITKCRTVYVEHKTASYKMCFYELLCIFPNDFSVPNGLRAFNFYGSPEWFRPYSIKNRNNENLQTILKKAKLQVLGKR